MIGIIGAMDREVDGLIAKLAQREEKTKASLVFHCGKIKEESVVIVKCGVGKVNAAFCAQILIDEFAVSCIINTGAAGSISREVGIGDVVVATEAVQHDMNAVDFGFPRGQVPFADVFAFPTDEALRKKAKECYEKINPGGRVFFGRVVTGDEFVSSSARKDAIVSEFGGLCTEMEGAAIAQVAYYNRVPFLLLRAISDRADDGAGMDFEEFSRMASERNIRLIMKMLEERYLNNEV